MATSEAATASQRRYWRPRTRTLPAGAAITATPHERVERFDWMSVQIAAAACAVVVVAFLVVEPDTLHWFVLPAYVCGVLVGVDAVQWVTGRRPLLDPAGLLGLIGLHFFFLAPFLHVFLDYYVPYVVPPSDWRDWLGWLGVLNVAGLLAYRVGRADSRRAVPKPDAATWVIQPLPFYASLVGAALLSVALQAAVYAKFGGVGGYVAIFSEQRAAAAFAGMGWVFMFSEAFPVLAAFIYAYYRHRSGRPVPLVEVLIVIALFFLAKILFGGLRGSRAAYVWPLFWVIGIIHLWVRPIPRSLISVGVGILIVFMYAYGLYKNYGSEAVHAIGDANLRETMAKQANRGFSATVLADLARSDVQAYVLYRTVTRDDVTPYRLAWGRTYVGAVAILIPGALWPDRPMHKIVEGTEMMFPKRIWRRGHYAYNAFGLAGETMLNFGPAAVPVAYGLFGLLVGRVRRWHQNLRPDDGRTLLAPFVVSLCLYVLIWDAEVVLYYIITSALLPAIILWMCVKRKHPGRA